MHTDLLIGGQGVAALTGGSCERRSPLTGEVATIAAAATSVDAERAADAAAAAFPEWSVLGPTERRQRLLRAADIVASRSADFAALMMAETGAKRDGLVLT